MKQLILCLTCLWFCTGMSIAQPPEIGDTAYVFAWWKKGDRQTYLIQREKIKKQGDVVKENITLQFLADVTVTDSTEKGYQLEWRYRFTDEFRKKFPEVVYLLPAYEGMRIKFTTTPEGGFEELLNWEEVVDTYVDMTMRSMPRRMNDTLKQVMEKVKAMFNSREAAEASLIREIQLFCSVYGGMFSQEGIRSETTLPNPFGDQPLPAYVTQRLYSKPNEKDLYEVGIEQQIRPEAVGSLLTAMMEKMDLPVDSMKTELKRMMSEMNIFDKGLFRIHEASGWINRLSFEREAKMAGTLQRESFLFELLEK